MGVVQLNPKSSSIVDKAYNIMIIKNTKNNPKPPISISQKHPHERDNSGPLLVICVFNFIVTIIKYTLSLSKKNYH